MVQTANQREGRVTTPATPAPKPVATPKPKAAAIPAPKTSAQIALDAQKILDQVNVGAAKLAGFETILATMAKGAGVSIDASGKIVPVTVVSSSYSGVGKDRTRTDKMSNGDIRTFSDPDPNYQEPVTGTTNVQALKAILKGRGIPTTLVDNSATFLTELSKEGLDEEAIAEIYLNSKDYTTKAGTTITSPFYSAYGFYNDGLTDKYTAAQLYQTVEGYKAAATKFDLNPKFTSTDFIQKYLKNGLSVKAFNDNANKARLADITADSATKTALETLGFIKPGQGLTDFFLDPDVGIEKMQENVNTAALTVEAVRRANAGIVVTPENLKKYGAALTAQGLSEGQVAGVASKGYQNVAASLQPMTKLSDIYNQPAGKTKTDIQTELEQQEFQGIESNLQKRLTEQEIMAFNARSGLTSQSLSSRSIAGQI
jgi:hypothetical protein